MAATLFRETSAQRSGGQDHDHHPGHDLYDMDDCDDDDDINKHIGQG